MSQCSNVFTSLLCFTHSDRIIIIKFQETVFKLDASVLLRELIQAIGSNQKVASRDVDELTILLSDELKQQTKNVCYLATQGRDLLQIG